MSQVLPPPALITVVGRATAVSVTSANTDSATMALSAPGTGIWVMSIAEIYNPSGTFTSHTGAFFSQAGGAGINLGNINLAAITSNTSRGMYVLQVKSYLPTTVYYRTLNAAAGPTATVDIVVYGIKLV